MPNRQDYMSVLEAKQNEITSKSHIVQAYSYNSFKHLFQFAPGKALGNRATMRT